MFIDHTLGSFGLLSNALENIKFQPTDRTYFKAAISIIKLFKAIPILPDLPSLASHASVDQMHYRVSQRSSFYGRGVESRRCCFYTEPDFVID